MFWYNAMIGTEFSVLYQDAEVYWVRASDGFINFIRLEDAIVL